MNLDYKAIGIRIKDMRSLRNMSQEQLAELAGLSTTHTSHIETGNTKVSLPTLVRIANALGTSLDELVCDSIFKARTMFEGEIARTISDCNELEVRIIADMAKALKISMRGRFKG